MYFFRVATVELYKNSFFLYYSLLMSSPTRPAPGNQRNTTKEQKEEENWSKIESLTKNSNCDLSYEIV